MNIDHAVADFLQRLYKIWEAVSGCQGPHLVTIALDGENAWEWYSNDKNEFLHKLYSRLSQEAWLQTVTVADFLRAYPPQRVLGIPFPGS